MILYYDLCVCVVYVYLSVSVCVAHSFSVRKWLPLLQSQVVNTKSWRGPSYSFSSGIDTHPSPDHTLKPNPSHCFTHSLTMYRMIIPRIRRLNCRFSVISETYYTVPRYDYRLYDYMNIQYEYTQNDPFNFDFECNKSQVKIAFTSPFQLKTNSNSKWVWYYSYNLNRLFPLIYR